MPSSRVALVLLGAGAALCFTAAALTWITVGSAVAGATLDLDGGTCVPALRAIALVSLAGIGGLLAAKGVMRKVIGALVTVAALGGLVPVVASVRDGFSAIAASSRPVSLDGTPAAVLHTSALGPTLAIIGLLLVVVGGLVAILARTQAAGLSERFDRTQSAPSAGSRFDDQATQASAASEDDNPATMWSALDRGEDPTRPTT